MASVLDTYSPGEVLQVLSRPWAGTHIGAARDEARELGAQFFEFNDEVIHTQTGEIVWRRVGCDC